MADDESRSSDTNVAGQSARANVKRELGGGGGKGSGNRRSASYIRSGARMLSREASAILRKHRGRLGDDIAEEIEVVVAKIEAIRATKPNEDLAELEYQAELLDELLHQHASFARKSALRDTLENIAIAVIVALGVRSCIYEPFKIPSGSMMPTLRAGDHIFVNKFAYGVQVPLTTKIVAEDWLSTIARGDVIVFRFPLDETDDFIKRVIGLPGDTIRVNGDRRKLWIKRAGESEFEAVERVALTDIKCQAENSTQAIDNCTVYRETIDGHDYVVRYRDDLRTSDPSLRTFEVPEGHLLVMGDNRNASHDSIAWSVNVDSVAAGGLLSRPDIRDITTVENERIELHDDGDTIRSNDDARRDAARYLAERNEPTRDLELEAWRSPPIDREAVFESIAAAYGAGEVTTFSKLMGSAATPSDRVAEYDEKLGDMRYAKADTAYELVFWAPDAKALFRLRCGVKRCLTPADLATRVATVVRSYEANPSYTARELLNHEYGRAKTYPGPGQVESRYLERRFGAGQGVHLRAWRSPHEGLDILRDAVLAEYGAGPLASVMQERHGLEPVEATAVESDLVVDPDSQAWVLERDGVFSVVHSDAKHEILAVLDCGAARCKKASDAIAMATTVATRFELVAKERDKLPTLLSQSDVGALPESPAGIGPSYYWDHLSLVGVLLDDSHSINIEVELEPPEGLQAALDARKADLENAEAIEGLGPSAWYADTANGHTFVFTIPETKLVVELACRPGLCPDRATARALADRAWEKGRDPENYIQRGVSRPRPFVPRGNVKGRAEVIWWPTSRFWMSIE